MWIVTEGMKTSINKLETITANARRKRLIVGPSDKQTKCGRLTDHAMFHGLGRGRLKLNNFVESTQKTDQGISCIKYINSQPIPSIEKKNTQSYIERNITLNYVAENKPTERHAYTYGSTKNAIENGGVGIFKISKESKQQQLDNSQVNLELR